jgi:UDP-glucose 4-epimerase
MTTSLITGGAGFLGSHVAKHLLDMGHKVIILDDLSGGDLKNAPIHERCLFVQGSILDTDLLAGCSKTQSLTTFFI